MTRRKGIRSNPGRPALDPKPIDKYVADSVCTTNRTGHTSWTKLNVTIHKFKVTNKTLQDQRRVLRVEVSNSYTEMYELNKKLLAKNQMGDSHPMTHSPPQHLSRLR